jgi:hypothetical protein
MTERKTVEPHESPLGRYDPDTDEGLFEVQLLNVPLHVMVLGREHHDEVMREFAVLALDERMSSEHVPARMLDLIETLGRQYGAASARPDAEIEAAIERGESTINLVYHVPAHVVEAADRLEELMAEADAFCRERQLLTLERSPLLMELSKWYLDQFRVQIAGGDPVPWTGPLDLG